MTDEIDEILKFVPKSGGGQPKGDEIDEILKFVPKSTLPVGGTYQPKPSPVPGGTPPISTITGKPETEYVPRDEPGASFATSMKTGLVDDPGTKVRIYAEARGIPVTRYRNRQGNIEFLNGKGRWQREVSEIPLDMLKAGVAGAVTDPRTYTGTAGAMIGGPKGAVAGSMAGGLIRKVIGAAVYGEPQSGLQNLLDIGMDGIFALGGEAMALPVKAGVNKYLGGAAARKLRFAGSEIQRGMLTPADHAKALYVQRIASQHGITLAPHQIYDKEGMTNMWMYLRKHPLTSDAVRSFEDNLAGQTDDAINRFIKDMGGYGDTPYGIGTRLKDAAGRAVDASIETRRAAARPHYQAAFDENPMVDVRPVVDYLNTELQNAKGPVRDALLHAKKLLEKPDLPRKTKATVEGGGEYDVPVARTEVSYDTSLQGLHGTKMALDELVEKSRDGSLGNTTRRLYQNVKKLLLEQMDAASPAYKTAREQFAEKSDPVDRLMENVIGQLADLGKDKQIGQASRILLSPTNMPDAALLREARAVVEAVDPALWKQTVGSYIRDVYENLLTTEEGKVFNAAGKLQKQLFGSVKRRQLMEAAMSPQEFARFSELMQIFQRAGIGTSRQSMTQPFAMIEKEMLPKFGSKAYQFAKAPKDTIVDWAFGKWNDMLLAGRQDALLGALVQPDVVDQLRSIRRLTPGSKKMIESFGVLTALVADRVDAADIALEAMLPAQRTPQGQGR